MYDVIDGVGEIEGDCISEFEAFSGVVGMARYHDFMSDGKHCIDTSEKGVSNRLFSVSIHAELTSCIKIHRI